MKAFRIDGYGKDGYITDVGEPVVGVNDVLIKVHAASINPVDLKIMSGELKRAISYKMPLILGSDVAGIITEIGSEVKKFKVGDEVYSIPNSKRIGTFAQYIAINADEIAMKPKTLSMIDAASIPLVSLTSWQAMVDRLKIRTGQKIFIPAGSGGLGSFAIQFAKYLGAYVATTTSTKNIDWVKKLGADEVIDYKTTNFEDVLSGYDAVLDTQGGDVLENSLKILKPGGKIVSVAGIFDINAARDMNANFIVKTAASLLSFNIVKKAKKHNVSYAFMLMTDSGEQLEKITKLIDEGIIHPVVDQVYPFEKISEALAYVKQGHAKGKVVVQMV